MEGNEYPESCFATLTSSGEGRGRAIAGPRNFPNTHIPPKLARESKAARHPARLQERATVITSKTKLQGNPAVDEIHWAQLIGLGARDCTSRVTTMSPGKCGQNPAAKVIDTAQASRINKAFSFSFMAFPHANARRGTAELGNIQKPFRSNPVHSRRKPQEILGSLDYTDFRR